MFRRSARPFSNLRRARFCSVSGCAICFYVFGSLRYLWRCRPRQAACDVSSRWATAGLRFHRDLGVSFPILLSLPLKLVLRQTTFDFLIKQTWCSWKLGGSRRLNECQGHRCSTLHSCSHAKAPHRLGSFCFQCLRGCHSRSFRLQWYSFPHRTKINSHLLSYRV